MAFKPKIYETAAEKKKDFWLGVGLFFALNIVLTLCQWGLGFGFISLSPNFNYSDPTFSALYSVLSIFFYILPWLINIGLIIYFAFTRGQIALGMVAGFGIALLLTLCLGLIFTVWCFYALGSGGY